MTPCHNAADFEFSPQEIETARQNNRLLSMEIEFSLRCNFQCPYCYVPEDVYFKDELTPEEICDVILQAKNLGAQKIIILGGEPSIYPQIKAMIRFIRGNDMTVEMFTNGSGITAEFARELFAQNVRVVLKMNTFQEELQDQLTGKKGAYHIIHTALKHLKQAGYPSENGFLAVSTIICRQNIDELPALWQWLRDQHIAPYFEIMTPQSKAKRNTWLEVGLPELKDFFTRIAAIDKERYGLTWTPQPPLVGNKCLRHQFSCVVTSKGDVFPCVGVTLPLGNIRARKLAEILQDSDVLAKLKDYRHSIKGSCASCGQADECYGCRGSAFQLTGDYLASDPLCWRNEGIRPKAED